MTESSLREAFIVGYSAGYERGVADADVGPGEIPDDEETAWARWRAQPAPVWFHCLRCNRDVPASEVSESEWMPGRIGTFHSCGDYAHPPWDADHQPLMVTHDPDGETAHPASERCSMCSAVLAPRVTAIEVPGIRVEYGDQSS